MLGVCLLTATVPSGLAQAASQGDTKATVTQAEQDIVTLSKDKWRWMAERNVEALDKLFAPEAIFVHMGAASVEEPGTRGHQEQNRCVQGHADPGGLGPLRRRARQSCSTRIPPRRGRRRERSRQSVQRDRGLRQGRRGVEARDRFRSPVCSPRSDAESHDAELIATEMPCSACPTQDAAGAARVSAPVTRWSGSSLRATRMVARRGFCKWCVETSGCGSMLGWRGIRACRLRWQ